jgi:2-polyprenyl-6-hydroxyphenyl methylase / 3-demethylubiquinone-9 3-methyltransferase
MTPAHAATSVDPAELEKFAAIAGQWWDPEGKFKPLHRLNPVRLGYIRDRLCAHFGRDPRSVRSLEGLALVDIGCGGGLIAEPMARLGAAVTGLDAAERNIAVARTHAEGQALAIGYRAATAEDLAAEGARFDVVLSLEIIEHVADPRAFVATSAALLRPGGVMIASTINRTARAYALAVVGAEYLLRWLPRGTHDWRKFVKPSELARHARAAGLEVRDLTGMAFSPVSGWRLDPHDVAVNYLMTAVKAE